jgi:hypothetical protein
MKYHGRSDGLGTHYQGFKYVGSSEVEVQSHQSCFLVGKCCDLQESELPTLVFPYPFWYFMLSGWTPYATLCIYLEVQTLNIEAACRMFIVAACALMSRRYPWCLGLKTTLTAYQRPKFCSSVPGWATCNGTWRLAVLHQQYQKDFLPYANEVQTLTTRTLFTFFGTESCGRHLGHNFMGSTLTTYIFTVIRAIAFRLVHKYYWAVLKKSSLQSPSF